MTPRQAIRQVEKCSAQLSRHVLSDAKSRSWYLSEPGKGSAHAYSVTWTRPGALALAGDLGEMTLVHPYAMPTWWDAVDWLGGARAGARSDFDYHLGKSSVREEYDAAETAAFIWRWVWEDHVGPGGRTARLTALADQLGFGPDQVKTRAGRRALKAGLTRTTEDPAATYELVTALGLDDFSGCQSLPPRALWQIAALYRWANLVAASPDYAEAKCRAAIAAEHRRQCLAADRRMPTDRYGESYQYLPGVAAAAPFRVQTQGV